MIEYAELVPFYKGETRINGWVVDAPASVVCFWSTEGISAGYMIIFN